MHIKNGKKRMIKSIKRVYIKNKIKKIERKDLYKLNPCLNLVNNLNKQYNQENMQSCFHNILKISKLFPPAKNENKFIYGKLIELELINTFNKFSLCTELDKYHDTGSEYKNDCLINKNKGQEIKFKATTEVDMKCQFDNNGQLKTCKIDD
jgi:hypothetical protein